MPADEPAAVVTIHVPITLRNALFTAARDAGIPLRKLLEIRAGVVRGVCRTCATTDPLRDRSCPWADETHTLCLNCAELDQRHGQWLALALALDPEAAR